MALLEKLKSLFGVGENGSKRRDRDGGVTVEADSTARSGREAPPPMSSRDREEAADADADDRAAVGSGNETGADEGDATSGDEDEISGDEGDEGPDDEDETAVESAGTESIAETIEEAEPETAADSSNESDEAAAGTDASGSTETISREATADGAAEPGEAVGPAETDAAPTTEKTTDSTPEPTEVESEPVTEIKGIGPAYGERLATAGVDSTLALAESDAEELAAETDIATSRIEEWIDRANDR